MSPHDDSITRIQPDVLQQFATDALRRAGLPEADADQIAGCLVQVDLRGIFTHGTHLLNRYIPEYREGRINPRPQVRIVRQTPVSAVLDGDGGGGYLTAVRAAEIVSDKALDAGIAVVGTHRHGHIGSVGIYARMVVGRDLVYLGSASGAVWTPPDEPRATVWDAMGAPPLCIGIPAAAGPPLIADVNTRMFSDRERLDEAMERFPEAVIRSMGFRFATTLLGGILGGSLPEGESRGAFSGAVRGSMMIAVRPDIVGNAAAFRSEVARIIQSSRTLDPLPGLKTAEVAGSLEWQRERAWAQDGIPISADHARTLEKVASLGIETPW